MDKIIASCIPAKGHAQADDAGLSRSALSDADAPPVFQPKQEVLTASIVITTFRRAAMLGQLLDALLPQVAGQPVEVIIVDNCPEGSARPVVERRTTPVLRYFHESRSGVVHARNRGVEAALGTYVILLDDDEVPEEGWLAAWLSQADGVTDASFGRIIPRLLAPCPIDLRRQVERNFSRDLRLPTGSEVSDLWPYFGTGNAMFHKERCLGSNPFDLRFNSRGGEDVWLIRGLVKRGRRLAWNHEAVVDELVPEDRMVLSYLRLRRFNQGQLRGILMYGEGGLFGLLRVSIWMLAGLIQYVGAGMTAVIASYVAPEQKADLLCRSSGGAGKVLWWRQARMQSYANAHEAGIRASSS